MGLTGNFSLTQGIFLSLNIVFVLANSGGPDEMSQSATFHLSLHCLPKYSFRCLQYTKGNTYVCVAI